MVPPLRPFPMKFVEKKSEQFLSSCEMYVSLVRDHKFTEPRRTSVFVIALSNIDQILMEIYETSASLEFRDLPSTTSNVRK